MGVIECFYGRLWSVTERAAYAHFLKKNGFEFYLYGPKGDASLRKEWSRAWTPAETKYFEDMQRAFKNLDIKFGLILSPQGLNAKIGLLEREQLRDKVKAMHDVGLDYLGIFFDDMKASPDMAERQIEVIEMLRSQMSIPLVFCPSYYCYDSLLEFLFGERPKDYFEKLGHHLSGGVEVLWTGEMIISPEITASHLLEVQKILRRKPFICDNFYAVDGPINCNFLKVQPPTGRGRDVFEQASHWGLNPMNQSELTQLAFHAFARYLFKDLTPEQAFEQTVRERCARPTAELILKEYKRWAEEGQDRVTPEQAHAWREVLAQKPGALEREILAWLDGEYIVGFDAIIEQSGF